MITSLVVLRDELVTSVLEVLAGATDLGALRRQVERLFGPIVAGVVT